MGLFAKWELGGGGGGGGRRGEVGGGRKKHSNTNSLELSDQWGFKLPVTTAERMSGDTDPSLTAAMLAAHSISRAAFFFFLLSLSLCVCVCVRLVSFFFLPLTPPSASEKIPTCTG